MYPSILANYVHRYYYIMSLFLFKYYAYVYIN